MKSFPDFIANTLRKIHKAFKLVYKMDEDKIKGLSA